MTPAPGPPRFEPDRRSPAGLGPLFGLACLLATSSGVVVLSILLGAVVVAVVRGRADGLDPERCSAICWPSMPVDPTRSGPGSEPGIAGSLWLLGLVAAFAIPVGVGAAVFLEEYAPPGRLRRIIQINIANLAGVPSIVYGILGLAVFVRAFGIKAAGAGADALGRRPDAEPAGPAGGRDRHPGGAADRARLAPPGRAGAGGDAVAGGPRPRPALGPAGHPDRGDPGPLAGDRRDGPAADGRRRRRRSSGSPRGPRAGTRPCRSRSTTTPRSPTPTFQAVAAGGILLLLALLLTMNATAIVIRNRYARSRPRLIRP